MTSELPNRRKPKSKPVDDFKKAQFINHSFAAADKDAFKRWAAENVGFIGDFIDKLCDDGYSITVKYDDFNECYASFMQTRVAKNSNFGFILTGRSRSGSMAALAVIYRHYVLFEADWPTDTVRKGAMDDE